MRKGALLLLIVVCTAVSPRIICADDKDFPVGKPVTWDLMNPKPAETGESIETPNQRRRRLGEPVVASFPPLEYGEAIETPNHLRQRVAAAEEIANRR
jgi:hypothetical protein